MPGHGTLPPLADVLIAHRLAGAAEVPLAADGWSGARLTRLEADGRRYVLKRDAVAWDWIARATADGPLLREAWFAAAQPMLPGRFVAPYLGVGRDGEALALLMPDLTGVLFDWEAPIGADEAAAVLAALAALHAGGGALARALEDQAGGPAPWCPLRERLLLLSRPSAEGYAADGVAAGRRFLEGWAAFDRQATHAARSVVDQLAADPAPLLAALAARPSTLLHGDLKLANVGVAPDGSLPLVDWQMVTVAPVAVELGWFLVSNVASLPWTPDETLARYAAEVDDDAGGPDLELAWVVGLLLRGWRKGLDAEAGVRFPWGGDGAADLALWCERAVDVAGRRL